MKLKSKQKNCHGNFLFVPKYYVSTTHAELSYEAIIPKIAPFLRLVRSSEGIILGTQKVKEEHKLKTMQYLEQLSDICHKQGTEYLGDHRYDLASVAAMHAISFHKKSGNSSNSGSEMIPLLVLLSNAYVGMSKLNSCPHSVSFKKRSFVFCSKLSMHNELHFVKGPKHIE